MPQIEETVSPAALPKHMEQKQDIQERNKKAAETAKVKAETWQIYLEMALKGLKWLGIAVGVIALLLAGGISIKELITIFSNAI